MATTVTWLPGQPIKVYKISWESNGSGAASVAVGEINGRVFGVVTVPSAVVGSVPTNLYDVTVADALGLSIHSDLNCSSTATLLTVPSSPIYSYFSAVTLTIANAGDTNAGDVYLYVEVPK